MPSITINIIDGYPPYTVTLDPGGIHFHFDDAGLKIINDVPVGEYTITVTDSAGCYDEGYVIVATTTTTTSTSTSTTTTTSTTAEPTTTTTSSTSTSTTTSTSTSTSTSTTTTTTTHAPYLLMETGDYLLFENGDFIRLEDLTP